MNAPFGRPRPGPSATDAGRAGRPDRPEHDARDLTDGGVEARIVLDDTAYVLRITRLGKLILTK